MTKQGFDSTMQRLRSAFGEKFYNNERTLAIWQNVKGFDDESFQKAANRLINTMRQPPLPKEVYDAVRQTTGQEAETNNYNCAVCKGIGTISATKIGTNHAPFSFRCPERCEASIYNVSKFIPEWTTSRSATFDLI